MFPNPRSRSETARSSSDLICAAAERLEGEDLAAAEEWRIDREERVLSSRADKNDPTFFHVRQQDVLLRPVEAMQFVHKQDGPLARFFQLCRGFLQHFAYFLDPRGDRIELTEVAACMLSDDVREGCLTRSRRTIENQRAKAVGLEHAPQ